VSIGGKVTVNLENGWMLVIWWGLLNIVGILCPDRRSTELHLWK